MFSSILCGDEKVRSFKQQFTRTAVRAVILKHNQILMIKSNNGDYKFPGGGLEKGETHEVALCREVLEETGYRMDVRMELVGEITEISQDLFNEEAAFVMQSYYYRTDVLGEPSEQSLDTYEAELGFVGEWIDLNEVIEANESIVEVGNPNCIPWLIRETLALKCIRDEMNKKK
ncbi:MAG: NUDIX hydrolase [Bacilli bacterium]